MLFSSSIILVLSAVSLAQAAAVSKRDGFTCKDGTAGTLLESSVVEGKPLTLYSCPVPVTNASNGTVARDTLAKRNYDLIGAPCTTYCYTPAGGGPNPNDCQTLADNYADSGDFTIPGGIGWYWTYGSCEVVQWNDISPAADLYYSYDTSNWAGIVSYVAWNCQATENAYGGTCNFYDASTVSNIVVEAS